MRTGRQVLGSWLAEARGASLALALPLLLAGCIGKNEVGRNTSDPCDGLNARLAGTWHKVEGTSLLPDEFTLTPADAVTGTYQSGDLTLAYGLEENCTGILLIDAQENLYQFWTIELLEDTAVVTGPWQRSAEFFNVARPPEPRNLQVTAAFAGEVAAFPGEQRHDFQVQSSQGLHLPVFYRDVLVDRDRPRRGLRDYAVTMVAENRWCELGNCHPEWFLLAQPAGASARVVALTGELAELRSATVGGLYKVGYRATPNRPVTEVNVYLPLAGAEVSDRIARDLIATNEFVRQARQRYGPIIDPLLLWRWFWQMGDYLGRPDTIPGSTSWSPYNGVITDDSACSIGDRLLRRCLMGGGCVATWYGIPTRLSKASDFSIGYAIGALGYDDPVQVFAQLFGSQNDPSATDAYFTGVLLARGRIAWRDVEAMVVDIYDAVADPDEKHRKLWPNAALPDNHVPQATDFDRWFMSPAFLAVPP